MVKRLKSPSEYIQGTGLLENLGTYISQYGDSALFISSQNGLVRMREKIEPSMNANLSRVDYIASGRECTFENIERLTQNAKENGNNIIVGAGGGKVLDIVKAAAYFAKLPVVIIPTVASTDAPCSSLSILYKENGEFAQYLYLQSPPVLVLVDTDTIVASPPRFIVAGMGDALATYFEARAVQRSGKNTAVSGKPTKTAFTLAETCYKTLLEDGLNAKRAVSVGAITPAVENIVEVNTYLSGVGFESGGLAAAHAIQKGFTHVPEFHDALHGEKVAFGTIAQLILEGAKSEELNEVVAFCHSVGLPITFAQLGSETLDDATLQKAAEISCASNTTMHNMPFEVTPANVFDALKTADEIGKNYIINYSSAF